MSAKVANFQRKTLKESLKNLEIAQDYFKIYKKVWFLGNKIKK